MYYPTSEIPDFDEQNLTRFNCFKCGWSGVPNNVWCPRESNSAGSLIHEEYISMRCRQCGAGQRMLPKDFVRAPPWTPERLIEFERLHPGPIEIVRRLFTGKKVWP